MNSGYRELFDNLRQRPGLFFNGADRYDVMVAFVTGVDIGDGVLTGFSEWLLPRYGGGNNIVWWGTVRMIALGPGTGALLTADMDEEQHRRAIRVLWALLDEFLAARRGMRGIYAAYGRWYEINHGSEEMLPPPGRPPSSEGEPPEEMPLGLDTTRFADSLRSAAAYAAPKDFDRLLDQAELNARSDERGQAIAEAIILMVESRGLIPIDAEGVLYRLRPGPLTDASRAEAIPVLRAARLRALEAAVSESPT